MKVKSEGKLEIVLDEDHMKKVTNGNTYRFEMLKQLTKTATLMEVSVNDHIEIKRLLVDNKTLLVRVATVTGIILTLLTAAVMT